METLPAIFNTCVDSSPYDQESLERHLNNDHFKGISNEIKDILKFSENPKICPLASFSNKNFLVHRNSGSSAVLRIPKLSFFFIDRSVERQNLEIVCKRNFCPLNIELFDDATGVMISTFLDDWKALKASSFIEWEKCKSASLFLKKLHMSDVKFKNIFDKFGMLSSFFNLLERLNPSSTKFGKVYDMYKKLVENDAKTQKILFEKVPCHNDPSPENFITYDDKIAMLDWEFSALNDPMWDISHFATILCLTTDKCAELLSTYKTSEVSKAKFYYFQPIIHLTSGVWALLNLYKNQSVLNEDVLNQIYEERYTMCCDILEGEAYKSSLNLLTSFDRNKL